MFQVIKTYVDWWLMTGFKVIWLTFELYSEGDISSSKSGPRLSEWQTIGIGHGCMVHFELLGAEETAKYQPCYFRGWPWRRTWLNYYEHQKNMQFLFFSLLPLYAFPGNVFSLVLITRFWNFYQDASINHFSLNKCLQYLMYRYRLVWANHAIRKLINMSPLFFIK